MERGTDQVKREARDQIPAERVKDAGAVARELRWRVRLAAGHYSDDESSASNAATATNGQALNGVGNKRKRIDWENAVGGKPRFRNFKPKVWDRIAEEVAESDTRVLKVRRPENGDHWEERWMDWRSELVDEDGDETVDVNRRHEILVKTRRTANGVERQRIERVVEEWVWSEGSQSLTSG
jgi:hypothetical protein